MSTIYSPIQGLTTPCRIAVIADTHVPDRIKQLPEPMLASLRSENPARIFHAGDISLPITLEQLEDIAPVIAVRGNCDFGPLLNLPSILHLSIGGEKVILTHGHGPLFRYLKDKWQYMKKGYDFERYWQYYKKDFPDADLIIFGHTHTPVDEKRDSQHLFNPGSVYPCKSNDFNPRYGVIEFQYSGNINTRFVAFDH